MKNSWTKTFRRLAAGAIVAGATVYSSAMSYAVCVLGQIACDDPDDAAHVCLFPLPLPTCRW